MWNGKMKAVTLSYDDGVAQDIRLIELLDRYGLRATFNLNPDRQRADAVFSKPPITVRHLTMEELRQPEDVAHARIYSRVLEMCTPVQITGEDRRQKIGSRKQSVVKEVLDL